jgi:hypothetical protein
MSRMLKMYGRVVSGCGCGEWGEKVEEVDGDVEEEGAEEAEGIVNGEVSTSEKDRHPSFHLSSTCSASPPLENRMRSPAFSMLTMRQRSSLAWA